MKISEEDKAILLMAVIVFIITIAIIYKGEHQESEEAPPPNTESVDSVEVLSFLDQTPEEGLYDALIYYEIHHPDIVYAQAILESGLGKSAVFRRTNNLFGLYNSKKGDYYSFNHWSESVVAYRNYIQRRYQPQNDYYEFLTRIKYASNPNYVRDLKAIVAKEYDKRRYISRDTVTEGQQLAP